MSTCSCSITYPDMFPCPNWDYDRSRSMFLRATGMESGWTRQRRRWPEKHTAGTLQFVMNTTTFSQWGEWMENNGNDFFRIPLEPFGATPVVYCIRLSAPYSFSYDAFDRVVVDTPIEFHRGDDAGVQP